MRRNRPPSPGRRLVAVLLAGLAVAGSSAGPGALAAGPAPARSAVSLLADPAFVAAADRGLDQLYDMHYAAAEREFARLAARYPGHPVGPFLGALPDWWRLVADPADTSRDARLMAALEEVIERSERFDRRRGDLDGRFFKGAALAFRGRLRSMRGDLLGAAVDCKRALALVREVAAEDPANVDLWFGLGLFDYFGDVLPQRFPVLRPAALFLPDADRERGVRRLEQVVRRGHFVRTEAAFFLFQIEMFFEEDYEDSLRWIAWLRREHPGNALFHELEGRLYARWGRRDRARAVFRRVLERYEAAAPGYSLAQAERAHYVMAVCDMRDGEYHLAIGRLAELEGLPDPAGQERPLRTLGRLRQGMALDALGQRRQAVSQYRRVLAREEVADSHQRARSHLRSPFRGVADEPKAEPAS